MRPRLVTDDVEALLQAGVPVELHSYPGTFHGSSLLPTADVSRRGTRDAFDALRRALTK